MNKHSFFLIVGLMISQLGWAQTAPNAEPVKVSAKQFAYTFLKEDILVMKENFKKVVSLYPGFYYTLDTSIHNKPFTAMIQRIIVATPIWKETGRYWFYEEDLLGGLLDEPISQHVVLITLEEDHKVRVKHYDIKSPENFAGAWRIPERLAALTQEDLVALADVCDNYMEIDEKDPTSFEFNYYQPCPVSLGNIAYQTGYQYLSFDGRRANLLGLNKDKKVLRKELEDTAHPLMPIKTLPVLLQRDFSGAVRANFTNEHLKQKSMMNKQEKELQEERQRLESQNRGN